MFFASILEAQAADGKVNSAPDHLEVIGATEVTIVIAAFTGYRDFQWSLDTPLEDVIAGAQAPFDSAARKSFEELQARQQSDHQRLFRRVSLRLRSAPGVANKPTSA